MLIKGSWCSLIRFFNVNHCYFVQSILRISCLSVNIINDVKDLRGYICFLFFEINCNKHRCLNLGEMLINYKHWDIISNLFFTIFMHCIFICSIKNELIL